MSSKFGSFRTANKSDSNNNHRNHGNGDEDDTHTSNFIGATSAATEIPGFAPRKSIARLRAAIDPNETDQVVHRGGAGSGRSSGKFGKSIRRQRTITGTSSVFPNEDQDLEPASSIMRSFSNTAAMDYHQQVGNSVPNSSHIDMRRVSSFPRPQKSVRAVSLSPKLLRKTYSMVRSAAASTMPSEVLKRAIHIVQEEQAMSQVPQYAIECNRLAQFVAERKKKRLLFKGEYLMIRKSQENHKMEYATHKENESKNFYPETLPFDYNRVVLKPIPGVPHSHYINASYVDSFYQPKAYIVAQACKTKQSAMDFWRMVWEQNSNCIVMLTKVFDFMKVMCMQYWPITRFVFGEIEIETAETHSYAHFTIRVFRLKKQDTDEQRLVYHFHFTEWEVKAYPYVSALLDFRRRLRKFREQNPCKGPIIVHCSDGGGRSGVYLAIDANLELAQEENIVDVFGYCKTLINSRQNLVDTLDHYIFIYEILVEALETCVAPFSTHEIQTRVTAYMQKKPDHNNENQFTIEYKLLSHLVPALRIGDCAGGHRLENRGKNRDVMVVPPDNARPYLSTLHGESKDYTYINAVYIDGFFRKNEWIITEWPKHSTVDSFWALVFDHNCHTVINLTNQGTSKSYPNFLHNKGRQIYGPFIVEVMNFNSYPYMTSHMVKIMKRTFILTELMMAGSGLQDVEVRVCCVITVKMWPLQNKLPLSTSGLIDLIKMARLWRKRAPDRPETKPCIVMSHNGYSRCGIYVAANIVIDQMDTDDEIDIFHAVKLIRLNRPQLVDHKDEYKFLYDLILHYYISTPEYHKKGQIAQQQQLQQQQLQQNHVTDFGGQTPTSTRPP